MPIYIIVDTFARWLPGREKRDEMRKTKKIRERRIRLQILDRNFHALPLTVIVTRNSISLVYQNQQQEKTFLPAAVWVASSEGWLP